MQRLFLHEFATKSFCVQFKFEFKILAQKHNHIKSDRNCYVKMIICTDIKDNSLSLIAKMRIKSDSLSLSF